MKETDDKIVVFGDSNYRFDIPKSKIIAAGRNVILDMDFPEISKYQVDKDAPLLTAQPIEKLNERHTLRIIMDLEMKKKINLL
jgi:hypothetical protein